MSKYREYLEDVYADITEEEINHFNFEPYQDILDGEELEMLQTLKAHIIVKHKLEVAGIQTSGGTVEKLED